jgi:hypothetical protein
VAQFLVWYDQNWQCFDVLKKIKIIFLNFLTFLTFFKSKFLLLSFKRSKSYLFSVQTSLFRAKWTHARLCTIKIGGVMAFWRNTPKTFFFSTFRVFSKSGFSDFYLSNQKVTFSVFRRVYSELNERTQGSVRSKLAELHRFEKKKNKIESIVNVC